MAPVAFTTPAAVAGSRTRTLPYVSTARPISSSFAGARIGTSAAHGRAVLPVRVAPARQNRVAAPVRMGRDTPLEDQRNVGIMAHIDAG